MKAPPVFYQMQEWLDDSASQNTPYAAALNDATNTVVSFIKPLTAASIAIGIMALIGAVVVCAIGINIYNSSLAYERERYKSHLMWVGFSTIVLGATAGILQLFAQLLR